jgi:hypothetical protein
MRGAREGLPKLVSPKGKQKDKGRGVEVKAVREDQI